jgi:hypothetical protein
MLPRTRSGGEKQRGVQRSLGGKLGGTFSVAWGSLLRPQHPGEMSASPEFPRDFLVIDNLIISI